MRDMFVLTRTNAECAQFCFYDHIRVYEVRRHAMNANALKRSTTLPADWMTGIDFIFARW